MNFISFNSVSSPNFLEKVANHMHVKCMWSAYLHIRCILYCFNKTLLPPKTTVRSLTTVLDSNLFCQHFKVSKSKSSWGFKHWCRTLWVSTLSFWITKYKNFWSFIKRGAESVSVYFLMRNVCVCCQNVHNTNTSTSQQTCPDLRHQSGLGAS